MELAQRLVYRAVENDFVYRHVLNRRPVREFRRHRHLHRPTLGDEAARVLKSLEETGLAVSHVDRFEGMREAFDRLRDEALREEAKRGASVPNGTDQARTYAFMANVLGSFPRFDPRSPFTLFACQPPILDIVSAYFGMFVQLRKYAVFRSLADAVSENSKWHRDGPCDAMVMRVFAYFNDVGDRNGAMRYARGTHSKCPQRSRSVVPDDRLEATATSCAGPAGTLLFADTRGYHRAGEFSIGERWLYYAMFTSPGFGRDYFTRVGRTVPRDATPQSWAVSSPLRMLDGFLPRWAR